MRTTASVFSPLPFTLLRVKWKCSSLDAPEETPLHWLLDGLGAIKVQYKRKKSGRNVRRAQNNQTAAAVARCDPTWSALGLAQTAWPLMTGECRSCRVFQVVKGC